MRRKSFRHAFSLVELCVVLIIVGVVVGAAIQFTMNTQDQSDNLRTKQRLAAINGALLKFRDTSGYFPCPALPSLAQTDNSFGEMDCSGGVSVNSANTPPVAGGVRIGAVPVRALNLPNEYAADAWGNLFTYAVTTSLATDAQSYTRNQAGIDVRGGDVDGASPGSAISLALTPGGQPAVAYVVLSHGEDGKGATALGGGATVACGSSTQIDVQNCNGDATFYAPEFNNGDVDNKFFDDFIVWATK